MLRTATPVLALGLSLLALPAHADVPVGWSNPDPVSPLAFLLVVLGAPLALLVVISLFVLAPGFTRGEGITGRDEHADDQWFGGRRSATELESSSAEDTPAITGGASGTW